MTGYDIYAAADRIGERLSSIDLGDWQVRIQDAVTAGATSTEILWELRWQLRKLMEEKPNLPRDLQYLISEAIEEINKTDN